MSDLQLERLILSERLDGYASMIAKKLVNRVSLSSGEQRLVAMLKIVSRVSDLWIDERWQANAMRDPRVAAE
jgi:hypothetical protein